MPCSQQRRSLNTPVFKSTLAAAWIFGAICLGHLTQQYISPNSRVGAGPRTGTIAKGVSPSQSFPPAPMPMPRPEPETASAISPGALLTGALAAAVVAFAAFTGWPQFGMQQEPVSAPERSAATLVQVIGAEQAPQRAAAPVLPGAVDAVAKGMAAAATFTGAAVAVTATQPRSFPPLGKRSLQPGGGQHLAAAAKAVQPERSLAVGGAQESCTSLTSPAVTPRAGPVMAMRASPMVTPKETVTEVKNAAVTAVPPRQQPQAQGAGMKSQNAELRSFLLSV